MTNYEYYKDKVMETNIGIPIVDGVPHFDGCGVHIYCKDCLRSVGNNCSDAKFVEWLFSEYEEPSVDWSKVPVDTPIYVKMAERCNWVPRYFAKYEDGKVYSWISGTTSFTADKNTDYTAWVYAKLAKEEDK